MLTTFRYTQIHLWHMIGKETLDSIQQDIKNPVISDPVSSPQYLFRRT